MGLYQDLQWGVEYTFYMPLVSQADTKKFQVNPTLASGDVQVSIDGGAYANIEDGGTFGDYVSVAPAGGTSVKVVVPAASMQGSNIEVRFIDAAGAEWCDASVLLQTRPPVVSTSGTADSGTTITLVDAALTQVDDYWLGQQLVLLNGSGLPQSCVITGFDAATDTITFSPAAATAVASGDHYEIRPVAGADVRLWKGETAGDQVSLADINAEVVDVVDNDLLVAGVTMSEAMRRIGALLSGKVSGAGTGTETFKDFAESLNTVVITVDASGNRTNVVYN